MFYYLTKDGDRWSPVVSANLAGYWWWRFRLAGLAGFDIVKVDDLNDPVPPLWDDVLQQS